MTFYTECDNLRTTYRPDPEPMPIAQREAIRRRMQITELEFFDVFDDCSVHLYQLMKDGGNVNAIGRLLRSTWEAHIDAKTEKYIELWGADA